LGFKVVQGHEWVVEVAILLSW